MINKNYFYGLVLMILGVLLLLLNLNILTFDIVLLILSIGLIILYSANNKILYLVGGLILFIVSSLSLIDDYVFINISIRPFVYLTSLSIGTLYLYYKNKNGGLLILSFALGFLGIHHLLGQLINMSLGWLRFVLLALAFYLAYLIGYKRNGIVWPKYISILILIVGGITLLASKAVVKLGLLKFILFAIPIIIVAFGIKIIFETIMERR